MGLHDCSNSVLSKDQDARNYDKPQGSSRFLFSSDHRNLARIHDKVIAKLDYITDCPRN